MGVFSIFPDRASTSAGEVDALYTFLLVVAGVFAGADAAGTELVVAAVAVGAVPLTGAAFGAACVAATGFAGVSGRFGIWIGC